MLWNLSTCFPKLKIILQSGPSVFKFNLKWTVIFLLGKFLHLHLQQAGIQHKNTLVPHLNGRWISKFLVEKIVSEKSSLIHSILYKTGTITSGFEGKKRKYHFLKIWTLLWYALSRAFSRKRKHPFRFLLGILLKSTENRKECFLKISSWLWYAFYKPSSNLENQMTVRMEYPAMISQERAGRRRRKGAGNPCRENGIRKQTRFQKGWFAYDKTEPT